MFSAGIKLLDRSCFTVEYGQPEGRVPYTLGPRRERKCEGGSCGFVGGTGKVNMFVCVCVCVF